MSWENSKALTPLKRDFLRQFFERNQSFFLTGGSALGIFYLQHRRSYDLDFFTLDTEHVNWHVLQNQVLAVAEAVGARCQSLTASPEFHRFQLTRDSESEILDFVIERVPQLDSQKEVFGIIRVDTLREIAVNKLCTLIGRCELKDLIDLYFLQQHGVDVLALFPQAQQKENGVEPAILSHLLSEVRVEQIPEYVLEPLEPAQLDAFIRQLQRSMAERAFPPSG